MDRVLNLSAFGDIIRDEDLGKKNSSRKNQESDPNKYGHIFKMLLQNAAQTKLLHWQSSFYGQHKALDDLFEKLMDLGDELAESIMGKYGKPILSDENLSLKIENFSDPEKGDLSPFLDSLYKCYSVDCKSILDGKRDVELINTVDEIVALVDKIKYLVSLR
jgi:DNA-binding ferritin-like protein